MTVDICKTFASLASLRNVHNIMVLCNAAQDLLQQKRQVQLMMRRQECPYCKMNIVAEQAEGMHMAAHMCDDNAGMQRSAI